jgi:hypothetical protein
MSRHPCGWFLCHPRGWPTADAQFLVPLVPAVGGGTSAITDLAVDPVALDHRLHSSALRHSCGSRTTSIGTETQGLISSTRRYHPTVLVLALNRQQVPRFVALSIGAAAGYLLVVGGVTAVIPTPLFVRMTPVTLPNLVFWIVPALLVGPLVASSVLPITPQTCDVGNRTVAGGLLSFLAVGCSLCNKLVVLALGASGALTYFEPIQPLLGLVAVGLLGYALWKRLGRAPAASAARWRQARPPFGG